MTLIVDIAKVARAALKWAFPKSKISVTSCSSIDVRWTDDGPSVEQVQDALLSAGCAKARSAWNGQRVLEANDYCSFRFDRYNAAERASEQQRCEQQRLEYEVQRRRENETVVAAQRAKDAAVKPVEWQQSSSVKDPAAFEAFEKLRQRAESDVSGDAERSRRPTWAPPLILGEELGELCYRLGYLTDNDKWIGRLWATFAAPKRSSRYLREHVSSLPLTGISCRGFQFHAGEARGPTHQILFEAQRTATGEWQFGPRWYPARYRSVKEHEWEYLLRERERCREMLRQQMQQEFQHLEPRIEQLTQQIDAIDAEDLVKARAHRERQQLHGGQHCIYFIDEHYNKYTWPSPITTIGSAICVREFADQISMVRSIKGANVFPLTELGRIDFRTDYGLRQRPYLLNIKKWIVLSADPGGALPAPDAPMTIEASPTPGKGAPADAQSVSKPTAKEVTGDEIIF